MKEKSSSSYFNFLLPVKSFIQAFFCWLIFMISSSQVAAQINVLGKPGYILTPSSSWNNKEPQAIIGLAYIPREYAVKPFYGSYYEELMVHATVDLTSFLRITFNLTYLPEIPDRMGIGDRHVDISLRLWKERKILPSLTLILTPPVGVSDPLSYNAIVSSKEFEWDGRKQVEISAGYGLTIKYLNSKNVGNNRLAPGFYPRTGFDEHYLNGFFAGAKFMPFDWVGISAEFDSRDFNGGLFVIIAKKLSIQMTAYGFGHLGGMLHLQLPLIYKPRELRNYGKN
jgi:hypothetical protein